MTRYSKGFEFATATTGINKFVKNAVDEITAKRLLSVSSLSEEALTSVTLKSSAHETPKSLKTIKNKNKKK